jgi:signal transduction histidine kinase
MRIPDPRTASPPRPHLPRPTARLRLTVLYGALFLVCAAALVAITYLLLASAFKPGYGSATRAPANLDPAQLAQRLLSQLLRELLIRSGIALGIVGVAALGLGWLVAGRILRPLATITATARRISATSLHERLDLPGPDDELKQLGDTLDGLLARLQASFEAQRHFVASASHELRTPLTADRALLQFALEDPAPAPRMWRSACEELLASNAEQEHLIEALLALASSEGGTEHHEPVDLSAIAEAVLLAPRREGRPLGLQVEAATKPAALHGDPILAERLVANLVDNAFRHNIPGGCVQITTATSRGRAVLSVTSTGPVIRPDEVEQLFQPFHRQQSRRAPSGSGHGLGLSIVRAIAAAHNATIKACAQPGGGLSIDVTFPRPPIADPPRATRPRPVGPAPDGSRLPARHEEPAVTTMAPLLTPQAAETSGRDRR